ncbi:hypothetical protein [Archangium violaceum]|uniref:Uncharacterized protein n=1 Tax=Archangium violaceum Cb vi76 TaxID=1406225 RepID=A0A084SVP6_9BACT|nr:hypothetical protein [Archangium violaceum]KFA92531.1 hypothetical protein Q664_14630 [Archangium violaceum Cb vi76]
MTEQTDVNDLTYALWRKRHPELMFPALPLESRSALRDVARRLAVAPAALRSIGAAVTLQYVGQREDAELLEAHRPQDDVLGKVFDDTVLALRNRPTQA